LFLENIAHGRQRCIVVGLKGFPGCTRSTPATADQTDLERGVIYGSINFARQYRGADQGPADQGGSFQKISARRGLIGVIRHNGNKQIRRFARKQSKALTRCQKLLLAWRLECWQSQCTVAGRLVKRLIFYGN
jgi:hypothetical protein